MCVWGVGEVGAAVAPGCLACQSFGSIFVLSGTFGCHFKLLGYRCGHSKQEGQRSMSGYRGCDA